MAPNDAVDRAPAVDMLDKRTTETLSTQAGGLILAALLQVLSQVAPVPLAERDGDPQLLQVLLQSFPA